MRPEKAPQREGEPESLGTSEIQQGSLWFYRLCHAAQSQEESAQRCALAWGGPAPCCRCCTNVLAIWLGSKPRFIPGPELRSGQDQNEGPFRETGTRIRGVWVCSSSVVEAPCVGSQGQDCLNVPALIILDIEPLGPKKTNLHCILTMCFRGHCAGPWAPASLSLTPYPVLKEPCYASVFLHL